MCLSCGVTIIGETSVRIDDTSFYFSHTGWWNYHLRKLLERLQVGLWGYVVAWNFGQELKQKKNYTRIFDHTRWS
jgi:hypothetical protein